jgi:ribosomal protein S27AE
MPVKNEDVHVCKMLNKKWCDCQDIPSKILKTARDTLNELKKRPLKQIKDGLSRSNLFCRECGHAGVLTRPIYGCAPGDTNGLACNAEEDFAICPNCGHWAVISNPFTLRPGSKI